MTCRVISILLGVLALSALLECSPSHADKSPPDGPALYSHTCALCHSAHGEGYVADNAPALANPTFLATASDAYLTRSIARGRPGTTMSAWDLAHGGPHDDAAIAALVAVIRSWQTAPSIEVNSAVVTGDAARGAPLFDSHCASCHGTTGHEGPYMQVANPEFLAIATDGYLAYAITHGRPGTPMASYENLLDSQQIADIVMLLRSWQKPVAQGDVPTPGTLGPIVLNAGGPEPAFTLGMRYTPADTIKHELDRGAAMVFLDARAPSDYVAGHLAGAIDVPFYEVDAYLDSIPRDRWIVCYCACPHAESGRAADTLIQNGYTKVTILDEGFFFWQNRGYPVHTGAFP